MSFNDPTPGPQSPAGPQSPSGPQAPGPQAPGPQAPPPPPESPQAPQSPQAPAGAALASPAVAGTPPLSSVGKRFGEYCLELLLFVFTLGIGWLIWTFIILGKGLTPAKQLLNMRVISVETGQVPSYGMMFLREFPAKFIIGVVASFTILGFILYFWLTWDDKNQELWDKMCGTVVVDDPEGALAPA
ncbi:MAG TPA: RDD family protein [Thermoleophilaceae bacterium]|nr:RDD family protein [Thermoleophilaceae bacterium]